MNTIRLTKNGRKIISKKSKTPLYTKPIDVRIKAVYNELIQSQSTDTQCVREGSWNLLQLKCQILGL